AYRQSGTAEIDRRQPKMRPIDRRLRSHRLQVVGRTCAIFRISIQTSTRRTAGRPWCSAAGGHDHANLALGRVELHERPLALGQQSMRRLLANSTLQSKTTI